MNITDKYQVYNRQKTRRKASQNHINIQSIKGTSAEKLLIARKIMQCILKDVEIMGKFNIRFKKNDRLPAYKAQSVLNGLIRSLCESLFSSIHAKCELEGCYNELNPKYIEATREKVEEGKEEEKIDYNANYWDNAGKYEYYEQKYGDQ